MKNKKLEKEIEVLVLTIVFCVVAVSVILFAIVKTYEKKSMEQLIEKEKPPVVENYSASIFLSGEADVEEEISSRFQKDGVMDFYPLLMELEPAVSNHDVSLFQLDDVVTSDYQGSGIPSKFVDDMASIGFSMVSLASENSLELGEQALLDSHSYWENQIMNTAGSHTSENSPTSIYEKNGITFGLLAYTMSENIEATQIKTPYVLDIYDDQRAVSDVQALANQVDVVLVYLEWDNLKEEVPTEKQKHIAKVVADAGADIIVGTNTKTIQPVEWIDDTIVYYSLGNLISIENKAVDRIGLVGSLYIQKTVVDGVVTIEKSQPKADLIYTSLTDQPKVLFLEDAGDELKNKETLIDEAKSIIQMYDNTIRVGGIK